MRIGLSRGTKELIDVALAIANMDTTTRLPEQYARMLEVEQPPQALLLLNRHPRRVDFALQRIRALKLLPGPELDGRQP